MYFNKHFVLIVVFLATVVSITAGFMLFWRTSPIDNYFPVSPASNLIPNINLDERLRICESIPNNTTQEVIETTRLFINLPEDIYPFENRQFNFNGATVGIITSGEGLPPQNEPLEEFVKNKCVTHYYDFEGNGAVDLKVKSAVPELPDYVIHFIVEGENK